MLLAIPCFAVAAPPQAGNTIPESTAAICSQLGQIAYWASTAHLAKSDERRLSEVRSAALRPNRLRAEVPEKLIGSAELAGSTSHGNAGEGLTSLEAAREDGILAAMYVYRQCLEGKLDGGGRSGWTSVARSVEATVFYDQDTVRASSLGATLWTLTNFASTEVLEGKSYLSSKAQFEFDCRAERYRVLGSIFYAGTDGTGKVTTSTSQTEPWSPVAPRTIALRLMKIACVR